jgi:DNA-directed RNA polymerase specialized sigma subunit
MEPQKLSGDQSVMVGMSGLSGIDSPSPSPTLTPPQVAEPTDSLLEPTYGREYRAWQAKPSPATTGALVRRVQPVLDKALMSYVNGKPSPMMRSQAKQLAIEAMGSYDPAKSKLQTHLLTRLQRLRRISAKETQIIGMPERVMLDRNALQSAESELEDQLGRDATTTELADHTGFSMKRIAQIRNVHAPMAEGAVSAADPTTGGQDPAVAQAGNYGVAEFVYDDINNDRDRLILEFSLGLHGRPKLSKTEIAKRLRLTPGAVTQRAAKIQAMIDEVADSEMIHG